MVAPSRIGQIPTYGQPAASGAAAAGYDGPIHEDDGGSARSAAVSWQQADVARAAELLAWTAGFRLVHEYVHYAAGCPATHGRLTA